MTVHQPSIALILILPLLCLSPAQSQTQPADHTVPKTAPASRYKGEFVLVHNKDPVCVNFNRNLNQFRHIDFDVCHPRLSPKFPEFSRPTWREVPLDWEIARKAFLTTALEDFNIANKEKFQWNERRWQNWLSEARVLADQGKLRMWMSDVDINHDGEIDSVGRIERAAPAREQPVEQRDCPYTSSGLWFFGEPKGPLFGPYKHFYFGGKTDLIHSSATQRTYAIAWTEMAMSEFDHRFPSPKGATRGVSVGLAREARESDPGEVCYVAWVPTGVSPRLDPNQRWIRQR